MTLTLSLFVLGWELGLAVHSLVCQEYYRFYSLNRQSVTELWHVIEARASVLWTFDELASLWSDPG